MPQLLTKTSTPFLSSERHGTVRLATPDFKAQPRVEAFLLIVTLHKMSHASPRTCREIWRTPVVRGSVSRTAGDRTSRQGEPSPFNIVTANDAAQPPFRCKPRKRSPFLVPSFPCCRVSDTTFSGLFRYIPIYLLKAPRVTTCAARQTDFPRGPWFVVFQRITPPRSHHFFCLSFLPIFSFPLAGRTRHLKAVPSVLGVPSERLPACKTRRTYAWADNYYRAKPACTVLRAQRCIKSSGP